MQKKPNSGSRLVKRWGGVVAGLLGLVGLILYISNYSSELYRLKQISVTGVLLLSVIILLGHFSIALKFQLSANVFGVNLSLWESLLLFQAGSFINLVPLNLGTGMRALYMKKVHRLKFVDFGLGFVGLMFSGLFSAGFLGIVFLWLLPQASSMLYILFLAYFIIPLLLFVIFQAIKSRIIAKLVANYRSPDFFQRFFDSFERGLKVIGKQPRVFLYWFGLDLLNGFVLGGRLWLIGTILGYPTNLASGMILQSASRLSAIVTLVPSGTIGLREALTGFGARGLGEAAVQGVIISTVDRIIVTAWIVLLGSISFFILKDKIANATQQDSLSEAKEFAG